MKNVTVLCEMDLLFYTLPYSLSLSSSPPTIISGKVCLQRGNLFFVSMEETSLDDLNKAMAAVALSDDAPASTPSPKPKTCRSDPELLEAICAYFFDDNGHAATMDVAKVADLEICDVRRFLDEEGYTTREVGRAIAQVNKLKDQRLAERAQRERETRMDTTGAYVKRLDDREHEKKEQEHSPFLKERSKALMRAKELMKRPDSRKEREERWRQVLTTAEMDIERGQMDPLVAVSIQHLAPTMAADGMIPLTEHSAEHSAKLEHCILNLLTLCTVVKTKERPSVNNWMATEGWSGSRLQQDGEGVAQVCAMGEPVIPGITNRCRQLAALQLRIEGPTGGAVGAGRFLPTAWPNQPQGGSVMPVTQQSDGTYGVDVTAIEMAYADMMDKVNYLHRQQEQLCREQEGILSKIQSTKAPTSEITEQLRTVTTTLRRLVDQQRTALDTAKARVGPPQNRTTTTQGVRFTRNRNHPKGSGSGSGRVGELATNNASHDF